MEEYEKNIIPRIEVVSEASFPDSQKNAVIKDTGSLYSAISRAGPGSTASRPAIILSLFLTAIRSF